MRKIFTQGVFCYKTCLFFLTVFLSVLFMETVAGAEENDTDVLYKASFYISDFSDTSYNRYTEIRNIYSADDRGELSIGKHRAGDRIPMYDIGFDDGTLHVAYCIEPGEDVSGDWLYDVCENGNSSDLHWKNLTENYPKVAENIKIVAGCASGYTGDKEARAAAQIIIWEIVSGMRDGETGEIIDSYLYDCVDGAGDFEEYYILFARKLCEYRKVPSCVRYTSDADTTVHTLIFDEEDMAFYLTLEDNENPYFKLVNWESLTGLTVVDSAAHKVVLKSEEYTHGIKKCSGLKNTDKYFSDENKFYIINSTNGGYRGQTLVSGTEKINVPLSFSYKYEEIGKLELFKSSEDENISGIQFEVSGIDSGKIFLTETDDSGYAQIYLKPGSYVVKEIVPDGYKDVSVQYADIRGNSVTDIYFHNTLVKYYNLEVNYFERDSGEQLKKSVSESLLEGSSYNLYEEVMLPIDGYIWDGYEGDEYIGENLSSDKVIDVYYITEQSDIPEEESIPDTSDNFSDVFCLSAFIIIIAVPALIYRKRFYE